MELWMEEGEGWQALAHLLEARFGLAGLPQAARTAAGKPWFPGRPELHFNLSHSGGLALCGAGRCPLGVDVERVRPRRAGLERHVLSLAELAWYEELGGGWESLYTLWTLKEAKVKCLGTGLRQAPRAIAVPLLAPGQAGRLEGLTFRAYAGPGWRAAVCTAGPEEPPAAIGGPIWQSVSFS